MEICVNVTIFCIINDDKIYVLKKKNCKCEKIKKFKFIATQRRKKIISKSFHLFPVSMKLFNFIEFITFQVEYIHKLIRCHFELRFYDNDDIFRELS
jgi:hypothetical protein